MGDYLLVVVLLEVSLDQIHSNAFQVSLENSLEVYLLGSLLELKMERFFVFLD